MYVSRMGCQDFMMMKHPTYVVPTCEFLSSFEFDENDGILNFRLGNQDHTIGLLVLSIANYLGFDIDNMPFDKLPGPSLIDLHMMEAMGMVKIGHMGVPILIGAQ